MPAAPLLFKAVQPSRSEGPGVFSKLADVRLSSAIKQDCREYFWPTTNQHLKRRSAFSGEEAMIDAVLNVAVFAALVLCIVGFSAWARKRVP